MGSVSRTRECETVSPFGLKRNTRPPADIREYSERSIIITIIYYLHFHITFNYITLLPLANCLLKHAIKNVSGVYLCNI